MKEAYEIFRKCFPDMPMTMDIFKELCEADRCILFKVRSGDKTVGFAMIKENEIKLMCVLPEYQRMGYGHALLEMSEGAASDHGSSVTVGSPGSRLFIGSPADTAGFFERFGYTFEEPVYAEMSGDTALLTAPEYAPREDIHFEVRQADDIIRKAVAAVEDDWVQFFDGGEVFCAVDGDRIASFCIIEENARCLISDGSTNVGVVGCVGTVPEYRRQGIGLETVYLASMELRRRGCGRIFIHYTHVYDWYAKIGFRTFLKLRIGGKQGKGSFPK